MCYGRPGYVVRMVRSVHIEGRGEGRSQLLRDYSHLKFAHFPSMGSDGPPFPPLAVENVIILENSEKNQGTPGGSVGTLYNPF